MELAENTSGSGLVRRLGEGQSNTDAQAVETSLAACTPTLTFTTLQLQGRTRCCCPVSYTHLTLPTILLV
eukprot:528445-Amphidinium_carterae.1